MFGHSRSLHDIFFGDLHLTDLLGDDADDLLHVVPVSQVENLKQVVEGLVLQSPAVLFVSLLLIEDVQESSESLNVGTLYADRLFFFPFISK